MPRPHLLWTNLSPPLRPTLSTHHTPQCTLTLRPTLNGNRLAQPSDTWDACSVAVSLVRGDDNSDFQTDFQHSNDDVAKEVKSDLKDWCGVGSQSVGDLRLAAGRSALAILKAWTTLSPDPEVSCLTWAEPQVVVLGKGDIELVEVAEGS